LYMARQWCYVFLGRYRPTQPGHTATAEAHPALDAPPHESPSLMLIPLGILAAFTVLLGFFGTPAWPWFQSFVTGKSAAFDFAELVRPETLSVMIMSSFVALAGLGTGYFLYGRKPIAAAAPDALEAMRPDVFTLLANKFYVDEMYEWSVVRLHAFWARACDWSDRVVANGAVQVISYAVIGLSWVVRVFDEFVVNSGFDEGCRGFISGGSFFSKLQNGRVQNYLRTVGLAVVFLVLLLLWGCQRS